MEYLERGSLRPFVGRMSLAQVAGVLEGLLAALSHAEATGIVHRDVKPENLLITADGGIKIADFGIAKAYQQVATEEMLTPAGATVGTPAYMAPEQAMGQEIGPWTDLYQTGVVAYELLAGDGAVPGRRRADRGDDEAHHRAGAAAARRHRSGARGVGDADAGQGRRASGRPNARAAWNDLEEIVVGQVGPLWRREARLGEHEPTVEHPTPLTPARFSSWQDYIPRRDPHATATAARARRRRPEVSAARRSAAAGRAARRRRDAGRRAGDAGAEPSRRRPSPTGRRRARVGRAGRADRPAADPPAGPSRPRRTDAAGRGRRRRRRPDAAAAADDAAARGDAAAGARRPRRRAPDAAGAAPRRAARAAEPTRDAPPPRLVPAAAPAAVPPPRPELHARTEAPTSPPPPKRRARVRDRWSRWRSPRSSSASWRPRRC